MKEIWQLISIKIYLSPSKNNICLRFHESHPIRKNRIFSGFPWVPHFERDLGEGGGFWRIWRQTELSCNWVTIERVCCVSHSSFEYNEREGGGGGILLHQANDGVDSSYLATPPTCADWYCGDNLQDQRDEKWGRSPFFLGCKKNSQLVILWKGLCLKLLLCK